MSPETQIAANNDESTLVEAPLAGTPEEELSPLHEAMIAEALKTQAALEAAVDEVFQLESFEAIEDFLCLSKIEGIVICQHRKLHYPSLEKR